jgi:metaxin
MPLDERSREEVPPNDRPTSSPRQQASRVRSFFSIPAPVKSLFDRVPVITYPANELPQRTPKPTKLPLLYIFSTDADAAAGRPSFNPSCLKCQTFLKIAGVNHRLISSNNHASPTGVLPFLFPAIHAPQTAQPAPLPIPSTKLLQYAIKQGTTNVSDPQENLRYEAYIALIEHRIRHAWLYNLYLDPQNFPAVAQKLYINSASGNPLVRLTLSHQLQKAAEAELLSSATVIDVPDLYSEAEKAFDALSALLGEDEWFFGAEGPGLFDASVFAYTHLLLDEKMGWREKRLLRGLRRKENLVAHRERLLSKYFGENGA